MAEDDGFTFDWVATRAALTYLSQQARDPARRGVVWCLVRKDRNLSRTVSTGSYAVYSYWPVIVAQQDVQTAIFAHETMP
jgi:hypothetical protein